MKAFNIFFLVAFLLSAILQYNDPDPLLWIPIYLYGALACWWALRGKYYPAMYAVGILAFLVYAVILFVEENGVWDWATKHNAENIAGSMKAEAPWIEDTREFGGLLLLIIALGGNWLYARRRKRLAV